MNHKLSALFLSSLLFAACGGDAPESGAGGGGETPPPMDDHGTPHALGELTIGSFKMTVIQEGEIEAGGEGAFDIEFGEGQPLPGTMRGWVGIESGVGSRKGKLDKVMGKLHGHFDVPDPMPADSALWLEIELDKGPIRGSIALHQ